MVHPITSSSKRRQTWVMLKPSLLCRNAAAARLASPQGLVGVPGLDDTIGIEEYNIITLRIDSGETVAFIAKAEGKADREGVQVFVTSIAEHERRMVAGVAKLHDPVVRSNRRQNPGDEVTRATVVGHHFIDCACGIDKACALASQ